MAPLPRPEITVPDLQASGAYDEYNPFVRHAPVKTTEEVFRFFANGYRREHGAEPEVTGNRKPSERDILSGMGAVSARVDS